MKKLGLAAVLMLAGLLLVAGCSASGGAKVYTAADSEITIKAGEQFTVSLVSNPSTGFSWTAGYDQSLLKQVSSQYQAGEDRPGAPGTERFTFSALKAGDAQLKFDYRRPWESVPSAETKTFTVHIK